MSNLRAFAPFFTFSGVAEQAMEFYSASLPGAKITTLQRYGTDHPFAKQDEADKVLFGAITFLDQQIMFMDMDAAHPAPAFSWATSVYINCGDEAEFDAIFGALSDGGLVMMGPEPVGQLRKVAWVTDKFGVTWQPVWA